MSPISSTEQAAAGASTKENPRLAYATGSTGLAITVRGSSRRIMIMRFRPANIRLINRRSNLPRLLLALSSGKQQQEQPYRLHRLTRSLHISRFAESSIPRSILQTIQPTSRTIAVVDTSGPTGRKPGKIDTPPSRGPKSASFSVHIKK